MKIVLNHKNKIQLTEDAINTLSFVKSYLEVKRLQEYIEIEDIINQLYESIVIIQKIYEDLIYIYRNKVKNEKKN